MPKYPDVSGDEAVKALKRLGFVFLRQKGSHAISRRDSRGCVVRCTARSTALRSRAFWNKPV